MKAHELATRLMQNPAADVLIESTFVGSEPALFEEVNIIMNNEANAYIIIPPFGHQLSRSALVTNKP